MKIPYIFKGSPSPAFREVFPDAVAVYKPQIKLAVQYGQEKHVLFALVDSGADVCLFPRGIADLLDIQIRKGERIDIAGIGGTRTPFYFHEIELFLGQFHIKTKAGFSLNDNIGVGAILGQKGFFEHFVVSYDYKNKFLEIRKHGLLPNFASKFSNN